VDKFIIDKDYDYSSLFEQEIAYIADNSSSKERRAMSIEREVDDLEAAKFMSTKVGNKYTGFINGMTSNGMFVELDDFGIDGFVQFEDLEDDFYIFDEKYMRAYGKRSNRRYSLGDKVDIIVSKVDTENYQITFNLINDSKPTKMINRKKKMERKYGKGKRKGHHK
jgi:ribonuclease R